MNPDFRRGSSLFVVEIYVAHLGHGYITETEETQRSLHLHLINSISKTISCNLIRDQTKVDQTRYTLNSKLSYNDSLDQMGYQCLIMNQPDVCESINCSQQKYNRLKLLTCQIPYAFKRNYEIATIFGMYTIPIWIAILLKNLNSNDDLRFIYQHPEVIGAAFGGLTSDHWVSIDGSFD
ncbi:hypothetical protein RF11_11835 [Thelohanellus kitauei]|uniref:Uncharacterized protein n=1 Tax=Thelohanellus kitauei TaxID=669202 RepID=A0A0C2JLG7_THEKT|nr:hypothetical protein RF11_11835 [Thelohanellus kitauei]